MSFLLTTSIIWETQADILYDQYAIAAGTKQIYPEYFAKAEDFFHIPFTILFYTSLWSVKIEVLLFFKRIGYEIRLFKAWWWCVLGITVATYVVCIGDFQFQCILGSLTHILSMFHLNLGLREVELINLQHTMEHWKLCISRIGF